MTSVCIRRRDSKDEYTQRRGLMRMQWEGGQEARLQEKPNLPKRWSWTSDLQNYDKINFCYLNPLSVTFCYGSPGRLIPGSEALPTQSFLPSSLLSLASDLPTSAPYLERYLAYKKYKLTLYISSNYRYSIYVDLRNLGTNWTCDLLKIKYLASLGLASFCQCKKWIR